METKKYRSRIKAWAIFFLCIDTSIADTLTLLYAFFIRKKVFTYSHEGFLCLIFRCFECEGFDFKVFTATVAFLPFICWFSGGFPVWRLTLSTLHKRSPPVWMLCSPCEHFDFKTFTLKTVENQKKTSIAWIGEYFFREIKYVYIRA